MSARARVYIYLCHAYFCVSVCLCFCLSVCNWIGDNRDRKTRGVGEGWGQKATDRHRKAQTNRQVETQPRDSQTSRREMNISTLLWLFRSKDRLNKDGKEGRGWAEQGVKRKTEVRTDDRREEDGRRTDDIRMEGRIACLFVGCLTSQQHASVSQGRTCLDNFTCCHTEIEAADQTFHLT